MADLTQGFQLVCRRYGLRVARGRRGTIGYSDIDIKCINRSGGALTGSADGSSVVTVKWDEFAEGELPPLKGLELTTEGVLGVVHWDEGSVADDKTCWVRVVGVHPYALVHGGTAVAVGDPLGFGSGMTAGEARKVTTFGSGGLVALAAQATAAAVATKVACLNRLGLAVY